MAPDAKDTTSMFSETTFNVLDFGAKIDGITLDSPAINAAIEACENSGGGRVALPAGTYHTGPIQLRSNVELYLEAGALVRFSRDFNDFPLCITFYEGQKTVQCRSPLWGEGLHNVAVTGEGVFDGQGEAWRPVKRFKLTEDEWEKLRQGGGVVDEPRGMWWPTTQAMQGEAVVRRMRAEGHEPRIEEFLPVRDYLRPNMVQLIECQGVRLDGPTFQNSPAWNVHLLMCEDVVVRNCTILNPWFAQNGDGLDIESCRRVEVSDCRVDVGDDAICLKSGKDAEGRRRNRPCEAITVRNCSVQHGHGGLVIGSEMSGGVRDVSVENCDFNGTDVGLRFKTARGRGGVVENITIRNISMSNIKGAAITFDMFYGGTAWGEGEKVSASYEPVSETTPQFRDVHIEDVTCHGAKVAIEMRGLPEMPIEGISIKNARIESEQGVYLQHASRIELHSVKVQVRMLPAIYADNVHFLSLRDFDGYQHSDARGLLAPGRKAASNGHGNGKTPA